MENNIRTIEENPEYFGAYLNMARHNMFLLVNRLTEKFQYPEFKKLDDDKDIANGEHILYKIFDPKTRKYELDRFNVYKFLVRRHYLPFIKIFHEKLGVQLDSNPIVRYDDLHGFLIEAFTLLNNLRNSYSHHLALDENGEPVTTREPEINSFAIDQIKTLFEKSKDFSFERFNKTQAEENYKHISSYIDKLFNNNKFGKHGFYFFINLFIEQKYAAKFLKKLQGFKNETTPPFRATLQAFTAYCVTVPDERLGSEDIKQALLMDMLNELQRCPKALFNHLSDDDKKKFEPQIEEDGKNNILLNSTDYKSIDDSDIDKLLAELTTLIRYEDRFPYFVLRYIDEFDLLPNIRFQIILGKLEIKCYEKNIINNVVNRRILKQINVYGKLSDFEDKENETLEALEIGDEEIHFDQYAPHYNMENNKIPFYLFDNGSQPKIKYPNPLANKSGDEALRNKPTGFISLNDLPKIALLAVDRRTAEIEEVIRGFIRQNNEIILNYDKLNEIKKQLNLKPDTFTRRVIKEKTYKDRKKNEEYIDYWKQRYEELNNHLPNRLLANQLPEQVLNFLLKVSNAGSKKLIHAKIKAIKEDCKFRVKKLSDKATKSQKNEEELKKGEFATFLARDIIDMIVDKDIKQRLTNIYYNKLQKQIAYFSTSKEDIIALCEELGLFDNQKGHVFLKKRMISNSKGVIDFYKHYLESKRAWIEKNLFVKGKNGGYVLPETAVLPLSLSKIREQVENKDFTKWLTNKQKMPVELPNTLFGKMIDKLRNRVSDTQPFYSYERIYKSDENENGKTLKHGLSAKEIKKSFGNKAANNEKDIRFAQTQDRVLKLICEDILTKEATNKVSIPLADMMPFQGSIFNTSKSFRQKIDKTDYFIIAEDSEQQKKEVERYLKLPIEERDAYDGQKGYEWTVKDFGRFKKLVHDRRIKKDGLLSYFEHRQVTYHFVEYQLSEYDKYREKIFELTFDLEKHIGSSHPDEIKALEAEKRRKGKNFKEIQFDVYIEVLKKHDILTDKLDRLKDVRNKFSHTQFPKYYDEIVRLTQEDNDDFEANRFVKGGVESLNLSVCKKIYEMYSGLCEQVKSSLK
jgi:hypothetical protein